MTELAADPVVTVTTYSWPFEMRASMPRTVWFAPRPVIACCVTAVGLAVSKVISWFPGRMPKARSARAGVAAAHATAAAVTTPRSSRRPNVDRPMADT